jgi:hypothetical protein
MRREVVVRYQCRIEFGRHSNHVRNIQADQKVRLRLWTRWHTGTAMLRRPSRMVVRQVGTDLLTVRIDLTGIGSDSSLSVRPRRVACHGTEDDAGRRGRPVHGDVR